jgi:endogenous inhibitor of DNA gyrase (YacG/DUF329 family)
MLALTKISNICQKLKRILSLDCRILWQKFMRGDAVMPYKICPYCGKTSYSAAESPSIEWLCPYCDKDISHAESLTSVPRKEKEEEEK